MSEVDLDTVLVRNDEPLTSRIDDEVVMLDIRQGNYFGLDATGAAIWDLLESPRSVAEVCAVLTARYDVPPDRCQAQVLPFLTELDRAALVRVVPTDGHPRSI